MGSSFRNAVWASYTSGTKILCIETNWCIICCSLEIFPSCLKNEFNPKKTYPSVMGHCWGGQYANCCVLVFRMWCCIVWYTWLWRPYSGLNHMGWKSHWYWVREQAWAKIKWVGMMQLACCSEKGRTVCCQTICSSGLMGMWDPRPWLHIPLDLSQQLYEVALLMMVKI